MRDVLGSLRSWYDTGQPFALATVVGTSKSAPRAPGAAMAVEPGGEVAGSVSGGCVEGAVYDLAQDVLGGEPPVLQTYGYSDSDAFAVGLTCGGSVSVFVQAVSRHRPPAGRRGARLDRGRAAGRAGHGDLRAGRGRRADGGLAGPGQRLARGRGARRRGHRRRARDARAGRHRAAALRPGRRAAPGRGHRVRRGVRAAAADAGLRRDRLRRRGGPDRLVPRLPGDRLRRARGVRHRPPVPGRRRGGRRVAAPLPGPPAGRRAHGDLRAHPRPEVRRPAAGGRAAHPGLVRRGDGLPQHPRRPAGPAARGRHDRGRAVPAALADRARPRRPHAGGDRGGGGGRDRRRPLGRHRACRSGDHRRRDG